MHKADAADLCTRLRKLIGEHPRPVQDDEREAMMIVNRLISAANWLGPNERTIALRSNLELWFHPERFKEAAEVDRCLAHLNENLELTVSLWERPHAD